MISMLKIYEIGRYIHLLKKLKKLSGLFFSKTIITCTWVKYFTSMYANCINNNQDNNSNWFFYVSHILID